MKILFSQDFSILAQLLGQELFTFDPLLFLKKKRIVVPNLNVKQWLMVQLAKNHPSHGIAGIELITLKQLVHSHFPMIPARFELRCLIYDYLSESKHRWELSCHLADLFFSYGECKAPDSQDWQQDFFEKIFSESSFRLPIHVLPGVGRIEEEIFGFGFDFLPEIYWRFLERFSACSLFLFSPCKEFWEDVHTDFEQKKLSSYWKKRGASSASQELVQQYFSEAPPLLANLGKLGREQLKILDGISFASEGIYREENSSSLLSSLQKEMISFKRGSLSSMKSDGSIKIVKTGSSKMRETEALLEEILKAREERDLQFSDILVLAPDIEPYAPLIEYVFSKRGVPYRFQNLHLSAKSPFYQGVVCLIDLVKKPWTEGSVSSLIQNPSFFKKQAHDPKKQEKWVRWISKIFQQGCSWEEGLQQLLCRSWSLVPGPKREQIGGAEMDELEELFILLKVLKEDLSSIADGVKTLDEWGEIWLKIFDKYLTCFYDDEIDLASRGEIISSMNQLCRSSLIQKSYPFAAVEEVLKKPFTASLNGNALHAVSCASIETGSIVPAKAIFLIGMDEESFPKRKTSSSLDLLRKGAPYAPDPSDKDRYLFLQILLNARDLLQISYGHLSGEDGRQVPPSLVVQELLRELNGAIIQETLPAKKSEEKLPSLFSLKSPPLVSEPKEKILLLSDLLEFARHPWKYYLNREKGMRLRDSQDKTFPMRKAVLSRQALKWPIETVLLLSEEKLPKPFHDAFFLDVSEKTEEDRKWLEVLGKKVVSLSFLQTAEEGKKTEFPPILVELKDGSVYHIVGNIREALEDGALVHGDNKIGSLLKNWPEVLCACIALQSPKIYFLKSGKIKTVNDPKKALQEFVEYYLRCKEHLSPLNPDWADTLLRKEEKKLSTEFQTEDPIYPWVLSRLEKTWQEQIGDWGWLKQNFSELIPLYPIKGENETV